MATMEQVNKELQDLKVKASVHEQRISMMEKDVLELKEESKALYEINTNVRLLAESMSSVKNDVADVKATVKDVKARNTQLGTKFEEELDGVREELNEVRNQPNKSKAEWWDKVVWLIVGGGLTAVVTGIISSITN